MLTATCKSPRLYLVTSERERVDGLDGFAAFVEQRFDTTDQCNYWWCTRHRSGFCADVKAVKELLESIGDNFTANEEG